MKLFKLTKIEDYGTEFWIRILYSDKWAIFQSAVSWYDYPEWPFVQIKMGQGYTFSFLFFCYKFGLSVDLLSRTWSNISEF